MADDFYSGKYGEARYEQSRYHEMVERLNLDTLLKSDEAKNHIIDIILSAGEVSKSYLIDILIEAINEEDISLDVILQLLAPRNYSVDTRLEGNPHLNYVFDILTTSDIVYTEHTLDTLIKELNEREDYNIDTLLEVLGVEKQVALDIILTSLKSTEINLDTILLGLQDVSHIIDIYVSRELTSDYDLNALLETELSRNYFSDVLSEKINVPKRAIMDILLHLENVDTENIIDVLLSRLMVDRNVVLDVILTLVKSNKMSLDALLQTDEIRKQFIIDALFSSLNIKKALVMDALLTYSNYINYAIDIVLTLANQESSYIADIILEMSDVELSYLQNVMLHFIRREGVLLDVILGLFSTQKYSIDLLVYSDLITAPYTFNVTPFTYKYIDDAIVTTSNLFIMDIDTSTLYSIIESSPTLYSQSIRNEAAD
jgi:hypothetical protein